MQQYGLVAGEYMGNQSVDIDALLDDAEMMGYNLNDIYENPEMLGGPFRNLFKRIGRRIGSRIRARIAQRRGGGGGGSRGDDDFVDDGQPFSISTPGGTMSLSDTGFSYVKTSDGKVVKIPNQVQGGIDAITKNPALLIGGAVLLVLFLKKKK